MIVSWKVWLTRWERRRSRSGMYSRTFSSSSGMLKTRCVEDMLKFWEERRVGRYWARKGF